VNHKIASGIIFAVAALIPLHEASATQIETAPATTYTVTLKKLELCASGSAIDSEGSTAPTCVSPLVLGTGSTAFDIAGVSAGAQLGNFARITDWPVGVTYTHLRMTLSRTFSIAGTLSSSGCRTDSTQISGGTSSTTYGTHDSGTGTAQTLSIVDNDTYGMGFPSDSEYWSNGLQLNGSDFYYTIELTEPFTSTATVPNVLISFNTQHGLSGYYGGEVCSLYPNYPSISVSFQ